MNDREQLIEKIKDSLEKIRPYLLADGGDVKFVDLSADMYVQVQLMGACGHCPFNENTLQAGVEQTLLQDIPQIKGVLAV